MTPAGAARLLAKCAAFDLRTVGESDVLAWHEALTDVDEHDALTAVSRHYGTTRDRIMPADVRRVAADIDRERRKAAREAREAADAQQRALEAGPITDRRADIRALLAAFGANHSVPVDADPIRERALIRARREHGRPDRPVDRTPRRRGGPPVAPPPSDDAVATLATRYLVDGYTPDEVSTRLGVSLSWLVDRVRRLRGDRRAA